MAFFGVSTYPNMKVAFGACHYHRLLSSSEHTNIFISQSILYSIVVSFHFFSQSIKVKWNCVCQDNPLRLVDLVIGNIPQDVGVPTVSL